MISQRTRQLLTTATSSTSVRTYVQRTIKPKAVTDANVSRSGRAYRKQSPREYGGNSNGSVDPDVMQAFRSLDKSGQPNVSQLANVYSLYEQEKEQKKYNGRKWRIANKHFKEYFKPEICLLTYAEKEQIRYLHQQDSAEWSVEALAEAFPASVESIVRIIKEPFRCLSVDEIERHDARVARHLERIKAGEIELTPELEAKLEIRKSIPINLGAISTPEIGLLVVDKSKAPLGTFARLVTPDAPPLDDEEEAPIISRTRTSEPKRSQKAAEPSDSTQGMDITQPQKMKPSYEESKMLSGMKRGRLTLKQFEQEIVKAQKGGRISESFPEIEQKKFEYLLTVQKPNVARPLPPPVLPGSDKYVPNTQDFVESNRIQKFSNTSSEKVEVNVDKGEAYIYKSETGLQKPFSARPQRIRLPTNSVKEGSVYKVGDSFYDQNGEFLYRPV